MMRARVRRRGAVYVAVLGTSLLVVSIGLGSLAVARSRMAIATQERDGAHARQVADSALEGVLRRLAAGSAWRGHEGTDPWLAGEAIAGGLVSVWLEDPEDGDLGDDAGDPVRVRIRAEAGGAVRRLELIVDFHRRARVLEPRVAAMDGIRIRDALLSGEGELLTPASIDADNAEVYLDAVAPPEQGIRGGTFHGLNRLEAVTGTMPTFGVLDTAWGSGATAIDRSPLPLGGTPLPGWDLGAESTEDFGDWNFNDCWCWPWISEMSAVQGAGVLAIHGRLWTDTGPDISVEELLNAGTKPRMRVRLRVHDPADAPMNVQLVLRYRTRTWIPFLWTGYWDYSSEVVHDGASTSCGADWVDLEVSTDHMSWDPRYTEVDYATIEVETPGSIADYLVDDGQVFDSALDATAPLLLHRVRLGPDSNPFGTPNAEGRYVIDLEGRDLVIRDCVINGTLVLRRAGDGTRIEGSVAWTPVVPGDPIVIVEGRLEVAPDGTPVQEEAIGVDLDGDGQRASVLPSVLDGVVFARGRMMVRGRPTIGGSLVSRGGIDFDGAAAEFLPRQGDPNHVPEGFIADAIEAFVRPGSLRILPGGGSL